MSLVMPDDAEQVVPRTEVIGSDVVAGPLDARTIAISDLLGPDVHILQTRSDWDLEEKRELHCTQLPKVEMS